VGPLGNKEILATVELVLSSETAYGFSVDYDAQANPIIKIAPKKKIDQNTVNAL
jgi:hypothetical protein